MTTTRTNPFARLLVLALLALCALPTSAATIITNGGTGYSETGAGWSSFSGYRYHSCVTGSADATATFAFTGLTAGLQYNVALSWTNDTANRGVDIPYAVLDSDGTTVLASGTLNENVPPAADFTDATINYQKLNTTGIFVPSGTSVSIRLGDGPCSDVSRFAIAYKAYLNLAPLASGTLANPTVTSSAVALSWTAATGGAGLGATPYHVQRAPDSSGSPGTYVNLGAAQAGTSYSDATGTAGTRYWYRVVSTDTASTAVTSNAIWAIRATPPTGTVEWLLNAATIVNAAPYDGTTTYQASNLYDGDYTTQYSSSATTNGWAGIDLGSGNAGTLSRVRYSPRSDAGNESQARSLHLEYATTSGGTWTDTGLATPAAYPFRFADNYFSASPGLSRQCWRLRNPADYFSLAELRFEGDLGSNQITWKPARPVITPGAGRYAAGQSVTIATPTGGASVYYTTDGTAPDNTKTLYAGALSLPSITSGTTYTVKAVAYHAGGVTQYSDVVTAIFSPAEFVPDSGSAPYGTGNVPQDWYSDAGALIEVHGGHINWDPPTSKYYWYGAYTSTSDARGVYCYSSTDLYNWHFEGMVAAVYSGGSGDQTRPHVLYNPTASIAANKYVLWLHDSQGTPSYGVCATSSSPTGPFTYTGAGRQRPVTAGPTTHDVLDFSFFHDPVSGKWYYVACTDVAGVIDAWELDATTDYTSFTGAFVSLVPAGGVEAPVLFYYNTRYWLLTSGSQTYTSTGAPSEVQVRSATTMAGLAAASNASPYAGTPSTVSYVAQPTCAFQVQGRDGFVFVADRWIPGEGGPDLYHARSVWWPVPPSAFSGGTLSMATPATWTLSALPSTASGVIQRRTPGEGRAGTRTPHLRLMPPPAFRTAA